MSIDWGFVCQSHDPELESEHWFNHGEAELRRIWADRDHLAKLVQDVYADVDTRISGAAWWLTAHKNCRVSLRNEYGDTEPVDGRESAALPLDASLESDV